jgi:hypothetical protein
MYMHSQVMLEQWLGHRWDADNIPTDNGDLPWAKATQNTFEAFGQSTRATATFESLDGSLWTRTVRSMHASEQNPVILIADRFSGPSAAAAKVFTLNLMADGPVQSTIGTLYPRIRTSPELPAGGSPALAPGGLNRFNFAGQWKIDWDLVTVSPTSQEVFISNWAHNWHPAPELNDWAAANPGRNFEERQHVFRLRGHDGFTVLLLPYLKGQRRAGLSITQDGQNVRITAANGEDMTVGGEFYAYKSSQQVVLTTHSAGVVTYEGIEISGGATEVVIRDGRVVITAHGAAGTRRIRLPGSWERKAPLIFVDGVYLLEYSGGEAVRVELNPF